MARRSRRARVLALIAAAAIAGTGAIAVRLADEARAEIDGGIFSSAEHDVRVSLPRGWRISDQPAFPGVILTMHRTRPRATMLLAVDPLPARDALSDSCAAASTYAAAIACEHMAVLAARGFAVDAVQAAARPWFDYTGTRRLSRQGIAVIGERVYTLVLAADTASARAQYARIFDRTLRSIRSAGGATTATEAGDGTTAGDTGDAGVPVIDATP